MAYEITSDYFPHLRLKVKNPDADDTKPSVSTNVSQRRSPLVSDIPHSHGGPGMRKCFYHLMVEILTFKLYVQ